MADRVHAPRSQTPTASSAAPSLPTTPQGRRPFRPYTPASLISSHFPPRTPGSARAPITPSSAITTCSSNAIDFTTVKIHTAKCSECDKRNMAIMRRCPGCTFQVCKPCYDRRENAGKNLAHGNMQSPGLPMMGGTVSVVRRRPASVIGTPGVLRTPSKIRTSGQGIQKANESAEKKKKKEEGRVTSTPKKRAAQPKKESYSSDESSSDEFFPDGDSPTLAKRHRTLDSIPTATSIRPSRKDPTPSTPPKFNDRILPPTDTYFDLSTTINYRPSTQPYDILMQAVGVNTPENPYQQHLLSRQNPIVSNPVIAIPDIVKRGFKPRPPATDALKSIHKQTSHPPNTEHEDHQQIPITSTSPPPPETIRNLIISKATTYWQNITLYADERDELLSTIKEAGRKWAVQLFNSLPVTIQERVTRGLDMRLEHIEKVRRLELENLIERVAARKMAELTQEEGTLGAVEMADRNAEAVKGAEKNSISPQNGGVFGQLFEKS